jgi:endonuclease YncB( thermonuclease family)
MKQSMRFLVMMIAMLVSSPVWALDAVVTDANTLQLGATKYRLDGIDAPEFDQVCIDPHADTWACGVDARDKLRALVRGRAVHCDDKGPDKTARPRRIGVCRIDGEGISLNRQLVRQGLALSTEAPAEGFKADEADARNNKRGLWSGCFTAPQDFRQWKIDGALLGASCPADKDAVLRTFLFPAEPAMPPGCAIKGKLALRARVTGKMGIYQMQGCRSYASLTKPNRWFCSEEDAQAAGFRKAYNCGNPHRK